MLMPPPDDLLDEVGRLLRPHERCWMVIPRVDIAMNVSDERPYGVERSATDGFPWQDAEPDFHQVEPRGTGRREMELHPWVRFEPCSDRGRRMRRRIVENHVQVPSAVPAMHNGQEVEKLHGGVSIVTCAEHWPRRHVECGIEARQTLAALVVAAARAPARAQGQ